MEIGNFPIVGPIKEYLILKVTNFYFNSQQSLRCVDDGGGL